MIIHQNFIGGNIKVVKQEENTVYLENELRDARIAVSADVKALSEVSGDFEVYIESDGLAERGSFIVNPEGKIVSYEVSAGNVGRNAEELLRKLQACQFVHEHGDEVCPAKWQPGAETLKPSLDLVGLL